jgi:hypothetical protein
MTDSLLLNLFNLGSKGKANAGVRGKKSIQTTKPSLPEKRRQALIFIKIAEGLGNLALSYHN